MRPQSNECIHSETPPRITSSAERGLRLTGRDARCVRPNSNECMHGETPPRITSIKERGFRLTGRDARCVRPNSNECMHGETPTVLGRTRRASLPANHFPTPVKHSRYPRSVEPPLLNIQQSKRGGKYYLLLGQNNKYYRRYNV